LLRWLNPRLAFGLVSGQRGYQRTGLLCFLFLKLSDSVNDDGQRKHGCDDGWHVVVDGDEGESRVFELADVVDQARVLEFLDCTSRLQIYGEDYGEQEQGQANGWIHLDQTILDSLGQSEIFVAFVEK